MKIAIIAPNFARDLVYGTNVQIYQMARRLASDHGYSVRIITENRLSHNRFQRDELKELNVSYLKRGTFSGVALPFALKSCSKIVANEKCDVIFTRNSASFSCISAILGKMTKIPVVHCVDVPWINLPKFISLMPTLIRTKRGKAPKLMVPNNAQQSLLAPLLTWGLKNVSSLVASSKNIQNMLLGFDGNIEAPKVIYPSVDLFATNKMPRSENVQQSVLYFGALAEWRGILDLVIAFSEVIKKKPRARLIVASPRKNIRDERRFNDIVRRNKLSENVFLKGFSRNIYADVLPLSDIVCLPFRYTGVDPPLTILESMAMCKTVISTNVGGTPEFIIDGKTGLLVNPHDVASLTEKILGILEDPNLVVKIGQNARTMVEQKCCWDVTLKEWSNTFETAELNGC